MTIKKYEPLNLYTNFKKSAERYPEMPIHFDEELVTFPELGLHSTYKNAKRLLSKKQLTYINSEFAKKKK